MADFDYLLVGGGLQNGLIALALLESSPAARIALVERGQSLGGNHTWCFHADDVPSRMRAWVDPLVDVRWPGYSVHFPNLTRVISSPYAAATSDRLHAAVTRRFAQAPQCELFLRQRAESIEAQQVRLGDGRVLTGTVVIDSRGPDPETSNAGYQKFLGLEVELDAPHALECPRLMDATLPQTDGFRFFYVLPLSATRLLIEDTYFSDHPELPLESLRSGVYEYAASQGYSIREVLRDESGVLPMPWEGQVQQVSSSPLVGGYRGGWFHPGTGYSFPVAARLADFVAAQPISRLFGSELAALADQQQKQIRYCHRLNKMLFHWFEPHDRWNVFERFYKLPEPLIRRFYALNMNATDRARILIGRPPRGFSLRAGLGRRSLVS